MARPAAERRERQRLVPARRRLPDPQRGVGRAPASRPAINGRAAVRPAGLRATRGAPTRASARMTSASRTSPGPMPSRAADSPTRIAATTRASAAERSRGRRQEVDAGDRRSGGRCSMRSPDCALLLRPAAPREYPPRAARPDVAIIAGRASSHRRTRLPGEHIPLARPADRGRGSTQLRLAFRFAAIRAG